MGALIYAFVSDVLFYVSKTGLIFFCIEHRGFVHLVVILKEMIKNRIQLCDYWPSGLKIFLNNKNITLKNLLGKFFRFSNKGVDLFF